jgi:hypothetical protein
MKLTLLFGGGVVVGTKKKTCYLDFFVDSLFFSDFFLGLPVEIN